MKKTTLAWLTVIAITLSGCAGQADPPAPQPVTPAVTIESLNARTFGLLQEERWDEALESAQAAVDQYPGDPSAHLFLGRAHLGLGQPNLAAEVWVAALEGDHAGNQEIAEALQDLIQHEDVSMAVADIDGDGRLDLLKVSGTHLTIHGGNGQRLYDGEVWASTFVELGHRVFVHPVAGTTPLIQVVIPSCPSAPQSQLFWFDAGAGAVRQVELEGPCASFGPTGDGRFSYGVRDGGFYFVNILRFEGGVLEADEQKSHLTWAPLPEQIGYYLSTIARWPLVDPSQLFTDTLLYEEFRVRTAEGAWEFYTVGEPTAEAVELQVRKDGAELGVLTVHLQEQESLKISDLIWP